jgi:hypothetical protein
MDQRIPVYFSVADDEYVGDICYNPEETSLEQIRQLAIDKVIFEKEMEKERDGIGFIVNRDIFVVDVDEDRIRVISTVGWCSGAIKMWHSMNDMRGQLGTLKKQIDQFPSFSSYRFPERPPHRFPEKDNSKEDS